jgi:hypothetical protein
MICLAAAIQLHPASRTVPKISSEPARTCAQPTPAGPARPGPGIPDPSKQPKSSYIRFAAEQPNECWQSAFTPYPLADRTDTEILTWLDDHSPGSFPGQRKRPVSL